MIVSAKYIIIITVILLVQIVSWFFLKKSKNKYKKYLPKTSYLIMFTAIKLAIKVILGMQLINYLN